MTVSATPAQNSGLLTALPFTFTYTEPEHTTLPFSLCDPCNFILMPTRNDGRSYLCSPSFAYAVLPFGGFFQSSMVTVPIGRSRSTLPEMLRTGPSWPSGTPFSLPNQCTVSFCGTVIVSPWLCLSDCSASFEFSHTPEPKHGPSMALAFAAAAVVTPNTSAPHRTSKPARTRRRIRPPLVRPP